MTAKLQPGWLARSLTWRGRTSRIGYWRVFLRLSAGTALIMIVSIFATMAAGWAGAVPAAALIPLLMANVAVAVRRLHDRNKSAWWLVPFVVLPLVLTGGGEMVLGSSEFGASATGALVVLLLALAGLGLSLWGWIEIGFLKGRPEPNRYGPA